MAAESTRTATAEPGLLLQTNREGVAYPSATNVYRMFSHHHDWHQVLRYNELRDVDEYHGSELDPLGLERTVDVDDDLVFQARMWLENAQSWTRTPAKDLVFDAMQSVARKQKYHPVCDYLAPLPAQWDGVPRIDEWLIKYCGAEDNEYTRAISAKVLIAACARAFSPGCKVDTALVLVGAQGAKKSTAIRILGGDENTIDTPIDIGGKDAYEGIRGAWIVEVAELAGMSGRDVEKLKAFFSSGKDSYRPPYGRKVVSRLRGCIFILSTNDVDFLKDATGSRRFWCVQVNNIDVEGLAKVRDQLWAEAALRYLQGEQWWLDNGLAEKAQHAAEAFTAVDPWEDMIAGKINGEKLTSVHTSEVYSWLEIDQKDRHAGTAQRIVRILCGRLGWVRPREAFVKDGIRARGFRCVTHTWNGDGAAHKEETYQSSGSSNLSMDDF